MPHKVTRRLPRPVSRKDDVNLAFALKVLRLSSSAGIALSYWLRKLGGFKPASSVSTPTKGGGRKLLHAATTFRACGEYFNLSACKSASVRNEGVRAKISRTGESE